MVLTFFVLFSLFVGASLAISGAARITRSQRQTPTRGSSALTPLAARGGRHRLPVQLLETAALMAICWISLVVVFLVPTLPLTREGLIGSGAIFCAFLLGLWWMYRRGSLRSIRETGSPL